jgi:hypothetical protein
MLQKMATWCAMVERMMNTNASAVKSDRRSQAKLELAKLLQLVCVRGFHGTASVTVSVQDGHIQHTKVNVERMIR